MKLYLDDEQMTNIRRIWINIVCFAFALLLLISLGVVIFVGIASLFT